LKKIEILISSEITLISSVYSKLNMAKEKVVEKKPDSKKTAVKVEEKAPKKVNSKSDAGEKDSKKKSTSEGEKRTNKYADVEKGDCPNKATAFAKLYFNVKSAHKWMNEYYTKYTIEKKKSKDDEGNESDGKVKILNSHYALTAADQVICLSLVNLASEKSKKATAGLYTITEENMLDNIKMNKDFNYTFGRFLDSYDSLGNYSPQMGLSKKAVMEFIETYAFNGGNTNINLDPRAFNLLMYIMLKNRILLAETAFQMILYAKKSSIDDRAILCAIKTIYTGQLGSTLYKKVEDVSKIVRGTVVEKEDVDTKKGSKESGKDKKSDKKDTKKDIKKDTKKDSKKNTNKKDESESEEEASGSDNESGSESGSGSDSD